MKLATRYILVLFLGMFVGAAIILDMGVLAEREAGKEALAPLPLNELRSFTEAFSRIKSDYVGPVEDKNLREAAVQGMLAGLDPHSSYLDADSFKDMRVETEGQFGGLCIEVTMENGFVKVVSPIEGTPAARAGIKPGDLVIRLDDTPVKGMTLSDAVKRMRGKPNTQITLTISRKGERAPIVVTLTRAVIRVQSVKSKLIEPGYAWVRVSQFQEATTENLVKHLE